MEIITGFIGWDDAGEENPDMYTDDGLEASSDDDEITAAEEGFMRGYLW